MDKIKAGVFVGLPDNVSSSDTPRCDLALRRQPGMAFGML